MASLVGSRVERKEDKRFLTGKGRYTSDINIAKEKVLNLLNESLQVLDPRHNHPEEIL